MAALRTEAEIRARIKDLTDFQERVAAVSPKNPLVLEIQYQISELRWVVGEMEDAGAGALLDAEEDLHAR